jgi:transcriptional activator of eps genes
MITRTVNDFELSRYFASFCGMDGGNLKAKLRIGGIEHGSDAEALCTVTPECEPGAWTTERRTEHSAQYRRWPYWRNVAKVVVGIQQASMRDDKLPVPALDWRIYRDRYLYSREGWEFKLNLFPLPTAHVSSEDWMKAYGAHPALADKERYRSLCRERGRFDFMRQLRLQHRPKVILATGVGSRNDFVDAFGLGEIEAQEVFIGVGKSLRRLFIYEQQYPDGSHTALVVTPFLGSPNGINSTALLNELASYVASWLAPDDFPALRLEN